jgi:hypothetical protein
MVIPVSIKPGQMALTRMPLPESWLRRGLDQVDDSGLGCRISRAARRRCEAGDAGGADDRPAAALRDHGAAYLIARNGPIRLTRRISAQSSAVCSEIDANPRNAGVGEEDVEAAMSAHVSRPAPSRRFVARVRNDIRAVATSAPTTVAPSLRNSSTVALPIPTRAGDDRDLACQPAMAAHSQLSILLIGARHGFQPWTRRDRVARPVRDFMDERCPPAGRRL